MTTTWTCWRDPAHTQIENHPTFGWPQCLECRAAPPYHERPAFLDERLELTLYVPAADGFIQRVCAPRSAIVGLPVGEERAIVYIEGWIHGPGQYADRDARGLWEAGVDHAASRMVTAYPTASCFSPQAHDVVEIGTFNPTTKAITIDNEEALTAWLTT